MAWRPVAGFAREKYGTTIARNGHLALASLRAPLTGHTFAPTSPAEVRVLDDQGDGAGADGNAVLELTIVEGRNRQVRRLCKRAGLPLARLTRVSVGPVRLGGLAEGRARALTSAEVDACVELCMPQGTRRARLPL